MVCESKSNFWNVLTILSFIMLLLLTLASKPIEKLAAVLSIKYERQAQIKVCQQIKQKEELFMSWVRQDWMGGCMTTTMAINQTLFKDDKEKLAALNKSWEAREGEPFASIEKYCSLEYAGLLADHNVEERTISNLYSGMNCNHIPEEKVNE